VPAGVEGDGAMVGLGVAGLSVGEGVGAIVGDTEGDAVGDGRAAVGATETDGLELMAGPAHAATRTRIRSAATG
jgi:hypothetical protein